MFSDCALKGYFEDSRIIGYLQSLNYLKNSRYARILSDNNIMSFDVLNLLQDSSFRRHMTNKQLLYFVWANLESPSLGELESDLDEHYKLDQFIKRCKEYLNDPKNIIENFKHYYKNISKNGTGFQIAGVTINYAPYDTFSSNSITWPTEEPKIDVIDQFISRWEKPTKSIDKTGYEQDDGCYTLFPETN